MKTLEGEFKKFQKENQIITGASQIFAKQNIIIPNDDKKQYLLKDDYENILASEEIPFRTLKRFIPDSHIMNLEEIYKYLNDNSEKFNTLFSISNPVSKKSTKPGYNIIKKILESVITSNGFDSMKHKSSWFNSNTGEVTIEISSYGSIDYVVRDHKVNFTNFEYKGDGVTPYDKYNIENKINSLKELSLLDNYIDLVFEYFKKSDSTKEEAYNKIRQYYSNHGVSLVVKILQKYENKIEIRYGVQTPSSGIFGDEQLITKSLYIYRDEFENLVKDILSNKKSIEKFKSRNVIGSYKTVLKDGGVWYINDKNIITIKLLLEEQNFLLDLTKKYFNGKSKKRPLYIGVVYNIMKDFERFYLAYENESISVPSAPNTSKFFASKAGWVKLDSDFWAEVSYYSRGIHFRYGFKVGENFKYGSPYSLLNFLLKYIMKNYGIYDNNNNPVRIVTSSGTNWSAVGID